MGRQRRGMVRTKHQMPRSIDQRALPLGVAAPQHEHDCAGLLRYLANDSIRQSLPPFARVTGRCAFLDGQTGVEQQDPMPGPSQQTSPRIRKCRDRLSQIALQLLKDVSQGRRNRYPRGDGKRQSFRLPAPMVRILPKNDDTHPRQGGQLQRTQRLRWKDRRATFQTLPQKGQQPLPCRRSKKSINQFPPVWRNRPVLWLDRQELARVHPNNSAKARPGSLAVMHALPTRKA